MTRENKLPILRQGSRTCETNNKGGWEGGELDDGKNNGEPIELEMRCNADRQVGCWIKHQG